MTRKGFSELRGIARSTLGYWLERLPESAASAESICQTVKSSPSWQRDYDELKARRGAGRARIAMIRRLCGIMRRMLLNGEKYHWLKEELYQRKLRQYRQALENAKKEQDAA